MIYVIINQQNGYFFHRQGKIIVFDTQEEANYMLQMFRQYATNRCVADFGPFGMMQVVEINGFVIDERNLDEIQAFPCGTINFKEIDTSY